MLQIINLSKKYNHVEVLSEVNLVIDKPGIYLINGENGSGKSTLLKIIARQVYKTSGSIRTSLIFSYLPDSFAFPRLMKVKKYLRHLNSLYSIKELNNYANAFELPINKRICELSRGNIQKLGIIQALTPQADCYLFDEPLNGLDEKAKKVFRQILEEKAKEKIFLISLHQKKYFSSENVTIIEVKGGELDVKKKKNKVLGTE